MTTDQTAVDAFLQCINLPGWTPGTYAEGLWVQTIEEVMVTAKAIINESTGTTDHVNRLRWAQRMLIDGLGFAVPYAYLVVQDSTIQANGVGASTDIQIAAALASRLNDLVASLPADL